MNDKNDDTNIYSIKNIHDQNYNEEYLEQNKGYPWQVLEKNEDVDLVIAHCISKESALQLATTAEKKYKALNQLASSD